MNVAVIAVIVAVASILSLIGVLVWHFTRRCDPPVNEEAARAAYQAKVKRMLAECPLDCGSDYTKGIIRNWYDKIYGKKGFINGPYIMKDINSSVNFNNEGCTVDYTTVGPTGKVESSKRVFSVAPYPGCQSTVEGVTTVEQATRNTARN